MYCPAITGTLMANEVIKIITETGEILSGKVLIFNILNNTFNTFSVNNIQENHEIKNLTGSVIHVTDKYTSIKYEAYYL